MHKSSFSLAGVSIAALAAILLWDASGLDLALSRLAGGPAGFSLRDNWWMTQVLHTGAKALAWLLLVAMSLFVTWPIGGVLRQLPMARRAQIAVSVLIGAGLITLLKSASHTSCPWDLKEFGGIATLASHWAGWVASDGGAGRCFPSGHASSGFAFLGSYFALRHHAPRLARICLAGALMAGFALGLVQQLRGAHFMSHTLWTGWLCWITAWAIDPLFVRQWTAAPARVMP